MRRFGFRTIVVIAVFHGLGWLAAALAQEAAPTERPREQRFQFTFEWFAGRFDADKDGKITKDEVSGPAARFFDRMDRDGDGVLTEADFRGRGQSRDDQPQRRPADAIRGRVLPEDVKAVRDIEYAKVGDQSLGLDLYLPENSDHKPPLLVWIHGGGWTGGSKSGVYPVLLRLTGEGYAVASVDYRLNGLAAHPEHTHDCKGAIRFLRANADKYGYDASRIGVAGGSAGGHLVLMLGMSADVKDLEGDIGGNLDQSSRVQAVVDLYGPSDFTRFANNSERFRSRYEAAAELFKSASPLTYLTKDDAPVLIFQGDSDQLVPQRQSELVHERYQEAGLESALYILEGAGHGGPQFNDDERYELVKAFFDKHIKQKKTADTAASDDEPAKEAPADNEDARREQRRTNQPDVARMFQRFDANEDGVLEGDEIPMQLRRRIEQMDENKDGEVSLAEMQKARGRMGGSGGSPDRRPGEVITGAAKGERFEDTLKVGDAAPDFTLPDPSGKHEVTLSSFQGKRPVVLIFGSYT